MQLLRLNGNDISIAGRRYVIDVDNQEFLNLVMPSNTSNQSQFLSSEFVEEEDSPRANV